ncbi:hypothetical protein [Streptomyces amritsarensis]|uniref:hypothetical protein n=1 Tax=Streptomyces amritsarensis TaxID=681158 RepID=UPI0036BDB62A
MSPELITAIATLTGVALGIVGTLAAARIQAKGSLAQADATFRAAETTAVTQYSAVLVQLNRTAQRAAYSAFLEAAREFDRQLERAKDGSEQWSTSDSMYEPLRRLRVAFSAVEIEGPTSVLDAGEPINQAARALASIIDRHKQIIWAQNKLLAARLVGNPPALHASRLLEDLWGANRNLPTRLRGRLIISGDAYSCAVAVGAETAAWVHAFDRARAALTQLVAGGVLTDQDVEDLLQEAGVHEDRVIDALSPHEDAFGSGVYSFTRAVRSHFSDTHPDLANSRTFGETDAS